jgi:hypothetical protein
MFSSSASRHRPSITGTIRWPFRLGKGKPVDRWYLGIPAAAADLELGMAAAAVDMQRWIQQKRETKLRQKSSLIL